MVEKIKESTDPWLEMKQSMAKFGSGKMWVNQNPDSEDYHF